MRFFAELPLWGIIALFAASAAVVWGAGTRLSRAVDAIGERTRLGKAFVGALLLGGITSLPEIATTVSASLIGNAPIAVNNIFGGIALQVAILALADAVMGPGALAGKIRTPGVLLEGMLLVFVLTVAAVGIGVGDVAVLGFGVWTAAVLVLAVAGVFFVRFYEEDPEWKPTDRPEREPDDRSDDVVEMQRRFHAKSTARLTSEITLTGLVVLVAGAALAQTGERIADETGLGASFVGAILIAFATSLPEVSTVVEAVRLGAPVMAISNILGTNLFDAGILFIADAAYAGPPVLNEVGLFAQVAALLGIACTTIYVVSILERNHRAIARLGIGSIAVLAVYLGGVALLYTLR